MSIDWHQVGEDFRQKYEETYCRYLSPLTKKNEVFYISSVEVYDDRPPVLILFNSKAGELYLNYDTEAELDFSFPETGYFQSGNKALRFYKRHARQWKKGVSASTAQCVFPYNEFILAESVGVNEETLTAAFKPPIVTPFSTAIKKLQDNEAFSLALNANMALGFGEEKGRYWLWFDEEVIATVGPDIKVEASHFLQEVQDFARDTRDNVRII
jgi:hypothetical protein